MNKHGLTRDIPEGVKREVRQASYGGCVICGNLPYTYEHFDPPFADATEHRPEGIALLCPKHQQERLAGTLTIGAVRRALANPCNRDHHPVWTTHFTEDRMRLNLFGNEVEGPSVGFAINGHVVFGIKAPQEPNGLWLMTGSFCDPSGRETLRFVDNEVITNNGAWDVTFEGPLLTVRSGPGTIVAQVGFRPEEGFIDLNRLQMRLGNDHLLRGTPTGIAIEGPQLKLVIDGISGSYASGNAFCYGPAATGQFSTLAVNDPRLGTFEDWRSVHS